MVPNVPAYLLGLTVHANPCGAARYSTQGGCMRQEQPQTSSTSRQVCTTASIGSHHSRVVSEVLLPFVSFMTVLSSYSPFLTSSMSIRYLNTYIILCTLCVYIHQLCKSCCFDRGLCMVFIIFSYGRGGHTDLMVGMDEKFHRYCLKYKLHELSHPMSLAMVAYSVMSTDGWFLILPWGEG